MNQRQPTSPAEDSHFFKLSQEMLCVVGFDGYFKRLNPMWEKTLGLSCEALVQAALIDFVHPDDRDATRAAWEKLVGEVRAMSFETRCRCADGSYKKLLWNAESIPEEESICAAVREVSCDPPAERAAAARFRSYFEQSPIGGAIASEDLSWLFVNDAFCKLLGYSRKQLLQKSLAELTHPDDREADAVQFEQVLSGEIDSYSYQARLLRQDGQVVWASLSIGCTRSESGAIASWLVQVQDDSDRAQIEAAQQRAIAELRESEARLRLALRGARIGVWDWNISTGQVTWSEGMESLFGLRRGAFAGTYFAYINLFHPDDRSRVMLAIARAVEAGADFNIEKRIIWPDGTVRWVHSSAEVLRDAFGEPIRTIGIVRDVTARKQAQEALEQAKEELERRVEARTAAFRHAIGQLQAEIAERKQREEALQESEARLISQAAQLEAALRELQTTQTQLIHTEKMSSLGQLVAGVAHEINNPVNFIFGNVNYATQYFQDLLQIVELYQQHYPQPSAEIREVTEAIDLDFLKIDLPRLLDSMKMGAERIQEIVRSLRNFSRLDEAQRKPVDIHEGIDNTLLILHHRLKPKSSLPPIEVVKEYGNLPLVECYAGQLNQVFMNILSNAIDALETQPPPRVITIRTSLSVECGMRSEELKGSNPLFSSTTQHSTLNTPHSQSVSISIADNGPGMTEEVRSRLFDPFFTTKPVGKGTGLGLSISYQIVVEKHHGSLQCFSTPGEGTVFAIEIPILPPE